MKRQGRFEVHESRAVLSRHDTFADAEDDAAAGSTCTFQARHSPRTLKMPRSALVDHRPFGSDW
jgi:hypothetical protein